MGEAVNERMEAIIKLPHPITKKQGTELWDFGVAVPGNVQKKSRSGTWGNGLVVNMAVLG